MKKIIVTGGLGFIGSNLIDLLLKKNYFVINIDKATYSSNYYNVKEFKNSKNYKFIKLDIKNKTYDELVVMLQNYNKERMNLRFQKSMGQLEKPSRVKIVRRDIARIKTLLNIKKDKVDA